MAETKRTPEALAQIEHVPPPGDWRRTKVEFRKVAYRSNRNGPDAKRLRFELDVPLLPGVNQVTVFARQSDEVQARQTLIVTRLGGRTPVAEPERLRELARHALLSATEGRARMPAMLQRKAATSTLI